MEKLTAQTKGLSGNNQELYLWDNSLITPCNYFIYEVCIYKYWRFGFCQFGSKYFKSDILLNIKYNNKYYRHGSYLLEKTIELIGAPIEFIKGNDLPKYKPILKIKKSKKK